MATQDVAVTLLWAQTSVVAVGVLPQADGSIILEVIGKTKDATNKDVQLTAARLHVAAGAVPVIDNILARALIELRKANGLEV